MKFLSARADLSSISRLRRGSSALPGLALQDFPIFSFSRFLILFVAATLLIPHASAQVVDFPDPNLRRAVREKLELPDGTPITQQEILRLKRLVATEAEIENITGLEYAIYLKSLTLPVNNIQDITPLRGLVNLQSLRLRNNPIEDLSPLANLTKLTDLNLSDVIIKDLTPLSNLTQLEELHLVHCQIIDITPLSNLTQLVWLNLRANQIVDVTPLANLTQLEKLWISENSILDFSPLQGLSLTDFQYDEECLLPDPPILDRIQNRSLPSTVRPWRVETVNQPHLSREERESYHDIYWTGLPFGLTYQSTPQGIQLKGDLERARAKREALASRNPNMLFLSAIRQRDARLNVHYPEDFPYWLRDEEGNLIRGSRKKPDVYLIDTTDPGLQDLIVQQAIAVSKCGLYDGIMFDWWIEGAVLADFVNADPPIFYRTSEEEREARISILKRIRANVPDDFLIVCNSGRRRMPFSAPYINGSFMENNPDDEEKGFTRGDIIEIEANLIWLEENLREPQINCLLGIGIPNEPYESPTNKRVMRLFTTMSLTVTDGYIHFAIGISGQRVHFRFPFLDADLGQPIGPKAQPYQEDIEGLYIREFTNGWAAYNRSGVAQTITLPSSATPVSDRGNNAASITHLLPDLDGEIYLKAKNPADVNRDGKINILDLVQVANGLGTAAPDPNGDGVVNTLDLVFVAQQFSQ